MAKRILTSLSILAASSFLGTAALAANTTPIRVRLLNCEPQWDKPDNAFQKGYSGEGYHNPAGSHYMRAHIAFYKDSDQSIDDALTNVSRIYLCKSKDNVMTCPTDSSNKLSDDYVLFDRSRSINKITTKRVVDWKGGSPTDRPDRGDALTSLNDLDWRDSTSSQVVVVPRIQLVGAPLPGKSADDFFADATNYGACSNWSLMSKNPDGSQILIYAPTRALPGTTARNLYDVCQREGEKNWWGEGAGTNQTVSAAVGEEVRLWMQQVQVSHEQRLQRAFDAQKRQYTWRNGKDPSTGAYRPSFVFLGPHLGSLGQSSRGGPQSNPQDFTFIDGSSLGDVRKAFADAKSLRSIAITVHEYHHRLQWAWDREVGYPDYCSYVSETMPSADVLNLCIPNFPGAASNSDHPLDGDCMNSGRLGLVNDEGPYGFKSRQKDPRYLLINDGSAALFWRYLYEQFSYPVGTNAHPGGTASTIRRPTTTTVLNSRFSDEGVDFVGWLYDGFTKVKDDPTTAFAAVDNVLREHLGRSFDDVLQDFHTALYLKDYTDSDERWRFEWTHGKGASATTLLSAGKPFAVPNELYEFTCDSAGATCDGLLRTHRVLDSWKKGSPATRDLLASTGSRVAAEPTYLGTYGTEAASVSPDSSWAGKTMRVRAWDRPGEHVRFRVFRIKSSGAKDLIPELQTTPAPFIDPTTMRETYEWQVAIDSNTKEVLLIASADVDGGSFEYEFGASLSTLAIVSPQESTPALIGHPSVGRRSFVIALLVKDSQGNVVYVPETKKSDLSIEIPGCSTTTNCKLSDSDYTIIPAVGGNLLLVVTVPASFYGSASSGTFDLKVTYANNATDTKVKALNYSNSSETLAATLLLDVSGSMGDFGGQKISALKKVAKGLIASLTPPDAGKPNPVVSMVTFTTDASTPFPLTEMTTSVRGQMEAAIDSLTPLYLTSIGDGLYEAQSGLAAKYDPSGNHLDREVVLLLTDGLNTTNSGPETYYATEPDPPNIPTGDGNGEWYKGKPLYFHQRVRDKLRVPTFTAVGIGQDADLTVLDKVTRLNKLNPLFVKGPEEDPTASPNRMTLDLADGMIAAFDTALDYSRVSTARITGPVPIPIPIAYLVTSVGADGGAATNVTTAVAPTIASETSIPVEAGAASLRVLVTSSHGGGGVGTLRRPNGQLWPATAVTGDGSSRAFHIPSPDAGTWVFASEASQGSEPDVIVAAAISGSLKLFAFADAQFRTSKGEVLAGSPVVLRSVAIDGGRAATSCAFMEASVTAPGQSDEMVISLVDDGKHNDGLSGDGVFGGIYRTTGTRGIYDVAFRSICTSPITGSWVVREQRSGLVVQLRSEDDPDGDGIPTSVEMMCMKPYDPSDADEDFDSDGLTNRQEFLIGTNPCLSDTDGGGLADGSEIGVSDPFDPTDDLMTAPLPELTAGNAKIHIKSGIVVGAGVLEIDAAPGTSGPWMPVNDAWLPGQNFAIHSGLINGTPYCYRLRYVAGTRASAWSYPLCATPNGDATPPTITVIANPQACGAAFAQPQFSFSDSPYPYDSWDTTIDLGLSSTGVSAMRIWEGVGPAPGTASWVAPQTAPVVKVSTTSSALSVQVRDGAGNLSRVATLPVSCTQPECFLKPNDIGCCAEAWSCGRARNYALLSESQLYVGDAVRVKNANGTSVPIANNGSGQTYIGVSAITGGVASVGAVDLRDRSRVEGSIECAGSVSVGNGVVVTGGINQASTSLHLPKLSGFAVTFPSGGADVNLGPGQTTTLSPGSYGSITVNASAELRLSTGTYYINNLTTEAQGKVKITSTNGPVYLYIKSTLNYRGTVTDIAGRFDNLFWGFFGTAAVSVEAPLVGTIVAPAAPISLKTISNGTHRGAVFAKQIDLQAQAAFVHYPFVGTWNAPTSP